MLVGSRRLKTFALQHRRRSSAAPPRGISPLLHVAADAEYRPHHISTEFVQASERLSLAGGPRHLAVNISSSPFENAGGNSGGLTLYGILPCIQGEPADVR
jgi:hypothetical protein